MEISHLCQVTTAYCRHIIQWRMWPVMQFVYISQTDRLLLSLSQWARAEAKPSYSSKCYSLRVYDAVSFWEDIFSSHKKKLQFIVVNLWKPKTHRFHFDEHVLAWNIVDESGPFESGVLKIASPEAQKNLYITWKTFPFRFSLHSTRCVDL